MDISRNDRTEKNQAFFTLTDVFCKTLILLCCILPYKVYSETITAPPSGAQIEYWGLSLCLCSLGTGDAGRFRGDSGLEVAWSACQWSARDASEGKGSEFVIVDFRPWATWSWGKYPWGPDEKYQCTLHETSNPDNINYVSIPVYHNYEDRTDICPDSHPIYNEETNQCEVDISRNSGHSICSLGTNPIHGLTGNKYQIENIYTSRNGSGLEFNWYYNSKVAEGESNWRHSYQKSIVTDLDSKINETASYADALPTKVTATVITADGNKYKYRNDVSWSTRNTVTNTWKNLTNNRGYVLETVTDQASGKAVGLKFYGRSNKIEEYSISGRLQKITNGDKRQIQISWINERVDSVSDEFGKAIQFHYDDMTGALNNITVDGDTYYTFRYHNGLLMAVVYPDDSPDVATDNPVREYRYTDARFPNHLTSIVDENRSTTAFWTYDDMGRAISSSHAGGTDQYTLSYNEDGTTTITDSLGNSRNYTFTNIDSLIRIDSSTGGACMACGSSSKAFEYDANGFVVSKTDWNGATTTYTRDDLGRELSRMEALGLPEERLVSTEWHPELQVPVSITEPDRITEFSYDDNGRLLSKTERAAP